MLGNVIPQKKKRRTVKVPEALEILAEEEAQKLIDMDKVTKIALERVEQSGIIFLDEIDKIVGGDSSSTVRMYRVKECREISADCGRFQR